VIFSLNAHYFNLFDMFFTSAMLSGISMLKIEQIKDVYIGVTTLRNCSFCFNITIYVGRLESYFHKFISQIVHKSGNLHIWDCYHLVH
jgi:hypothetical protein